MSSRIHVPHALIDIYERTGVSVPSRARSVSPRALARLIGWGRTLLGAAFLAAPVLSVRVLGLDVETAKRIALVARMAAVRDIAIGGGTVLAARGDGDPSAWLVAGAVADAGDAALITAAIRERRAGGLPAAGIAVGALVAAGAAGWAAAGVRRRG